MARPLTTPESNLLNGSAYQVSLRVLIADGDNVLRDYSNRSGHNWIDGVSINHDIDQPVSQATITLRRDIKDNSGSVLSLSPLRTDSILNRNAASQFSPAIDAGRRVEVYAATTAVGVAPISSDWKNIFVGTIDEGDYTRPQISLVARDLGGFLVDRWIEERTQYGSTEGVPIQTVMQTILNNWAGGIPLYTPVSPGFLIKPYQQDEQPVMEALQSLADLIGWNVRYKWDNPTSSWRLTLWGPSRSKTTPDRTLGPSRYIDVSALRIGRADVRNVIKLNYPDSITGEPKSVIRTDANSILKYGRRWLRIVEGGNSSIDTKAEAEAMADAILADLKDPKADNGIDMHFDWSIELEDLIRFQPNGVHYDTNTDLSVVSLQHTLSMDRQRTNIATRGKPCGKFLGWIAKEALAGSPGPGFALSQGTVSIDENGSWSFTADGSADTRSFRWLASTLGYPTDNDVAAIGHTVAGRTISISNGGTLSLGDTIHITLIPYTGQSGGAAGPSVHIRGSYQTFSITKTVHYAVTGFTLTGMAIGATTGFESDNVKLWQNPSAQMASYRSIITIPDGCVIIELGQHLRFNAGSLFPGIREVLTRIARVSGTTYVELGSAGAVPSTWSSDPNSNWQLKTILLNEDTTGNSYAIICTIQNQTATPNPEDLAIGSFYITYSIPSPQVAV